LKNIKISERKINPTPGYKHKSGSFKRKMADQRALEDAAKDEKQQKLSDKFFVPQPQVGLNILTLFTTI